VKILVLTNLYPPDAIGGYERGCSQVVNALQARGHEVRVLAGAPRRPVASEPHVHRSFKLTEIWDHYYLINCFASTRLLDEAESSRFHAYNVHSLIAELEDFQPDVVYAWMLVGVGGLGLMACLNYLRVPWVWHLMDDVPIILCKIRGLVAPGLAREFERLFRGTFLACSQQLVQEIEAGGITLAGDIEIMPNWVQGPRPQPRSQYFCNGHLRIVTAAGLIERQVDKGIDLLIEAAARLRDQGHHGFSVDIYGHVNDAYYFSLLHKHRVTDCVAFRGSRSQAELMSLYADYDLFAFPTRTREPFGFAPLEAAASGCVPVMTQVCGIAEWFVHGAHCLKAPRTVEAFAAAIGKVLDRSIDLEPIGRRVNAAVCRDFHIDAIVPRIEDALERASRQPRTGCGTPDEAYRMAVLAERLDRILVQDNLTAEAQKKARDAVAIAS
jgi:glycogen synthase